MTDDDDALRGDEELSAELAAIDRSRRDDGPAELRVLAGRPDLLALARDHQETVHARRAIVVELLSDTALPHRLAMLDAWLAGERDALAADREHLAGLPVPAVADQGREASRQHHDRGVMRQRIDIRLRAIDRRAVTRAEVAARRRRKAVAFEQPEEASAGLYFGPWRGFSPLG